MASPVSRLKDQIVILVSAALNPRLRPQARKKELAHELGISVLAVQRAVRTLTEEGRIVFTYRNPFARKNHQESKGEKR